MSSPAFDSVLLQHAADIQALHIPSLADHVVSSGHVAASPYVDQFKLLQIKQELICIRKQVAGRHSSSSAHAHTLKSVDSLLSSVEEKIFVARKLAAVYNAQYQQEQRPNEASEPQTATEAAETVDEDDLTSLRRRLLSGGQHTQHLDDESNTDGLNDYHESMQENILSDLSDLTSTLKSSAIALSTKILNDDFQILNETNENIIKNSSMFKLIDRNLNNYLENKTGSKISLFFLLKATAALVLVFFFMIIFVKIIPKIG